MWDVLCPAVLRLIGTSPMQHGLEIHPLFYFHLPEYIYPVLILFLDYNL